MKDGTRELTNNQWLLKADADKLPATYAELVTLLTGAGLPFGRTLLSDGWTIEPDPLNKANLLPDATGALYGLTSTAQIKDVLNAIEPRLFQSASLATNGYAKIGDFVIQWGTSSVDYGAGVTNVTLPVAFDTACLCVVTSFIGKLAAGCAPNIGVHTQTTLALGYYRTTDPGYNLDMNWIAIGY